MRSRPRAGTSAGYGAVILAALRMRWGKTLALTGLVVGTLATGAQAAEHRLTPRLGLVGQKLQGPQTKMSEAGVRLFVTNWLALSLSYERTGYAPVMSFDHDDGIMTAVKFGF